MSCRQTVRGPWAWRLGALVLLAGAAPARAAEQTPYPGDAGQAIAAIVVFVVLLVILGKWAWKPIVQQLQRREEAINSAIQRAGQREKEAEQLLGAYRSRMEAVEGEARQMLAKTRQEALADREQILAEAKDGARQAVASAQEDIERAKKRALLSLQDATARLATEIAGQVLRKNLTQEMHQQLMEESLDEIRKRAAKEP